MRINVHKVSVVPVLSFLLPLLLSGCLREFSGEARNIPATEIIEVTVPTCQVTPTVEELPAGKPAVEQKRP